MAEPVARVVKVDGSNVVLDVPREAFAAAGVDPSAYPVLLGNRLSPFGGYRLKVGAAGTRYLGDTAGIGEDPSRWPILLAEEASRLVAAAVPHAEERIRLMRAAGKRVPTAVYSNDLARVRDDSPTLIRGRYRASAASTREYEELVQRIKRTTTPTEDKAELLEDVLLSLSESTLVQPSDRWDLFQPLDAARDDQRLEEPTQRKELGRLAEHFLQSAEHLARLFESESTLDWSGIVIGFCKAFEVESVDRVIEPLKREVSSLPIPETDVRDNDIGRVAAYCAGKSPKPPELGAIRHFLNTAAHSRRRAKESTVLQGFLGLLSSWPGSSWLVEPKGAIEAIATLADRYRNRAAHTDSLSFDDYVSCRDFVTGSQGIMWKLVHATSP